MTDEIRKAIKSIQTRHSHSIRRLSQLERRLEEITKEHEGAAEVETSSSLMGFFKRLIYGKPGGDDAAAA